VLVGSRRCGLWLVIVVSAVLLACLAALLLTRYNRQVYPQNPMHEQTRSIPGGGIRSITGGSATCSAAAPS
jgi:hypothetical protein